MTASTLPTPDGRATSTHPRLRRALVIAGTIAIAVVACWLWYASQMAERNAITQLPAQDRRALYQRTLHTLRTTCDPARHPTGLETFCHEQAEFILQFPECDQVCQTLAKKHQTQPTK